MTAFSHSCGGPSRRELLRVGGLSALGLSLPQLRAGQAAGGDRAAPAKSCIVLFLTGGPPQHSTWDPKPDAPAEVRGEFGPIETNVPGVRISSLFPRIARHADKLAVLRAVATNDNAHSSSGYQMLTGVAHTPLNAENVNPGPPNDYPTLGAVVRRLHGDRGGLPGAVRLPMHIFNTDSSVWPGQDAGFLGRPSDPWLFRCEPATPTFRLPEFTLTPDVPVERLADRRDLFRRLDHGIAAGADSREGSSNRYTEQAFDLLSSPAARAAFDLARESPTVRDAYGRNQFGQSCLLGRRLVEAGVGLVHVNWFRGPEEPSEAPCWDTHTREAERLKNPLAPTADHAIAALLDDLSNRGLLETTLVMCLSEFGRTPKLNGRAGRDHWGHVFSVALAGGGIKGGRVYGASDRHGGFPKDGRVSAQDLTATALHCLGYEPSVEIRDNLNRPLPASRGRVIRDIV